MISKKLLFTFLAFAILVAALSSCGGNDGNHITLSSLDHFTIDYWLDCLDGDYFHIESEREYDHSIYSNDLEYAMALWKDGLDWGEVYRWDDYSVRFYDEDVRFIIWILPDGYVQKFGFAFKTNESIINAENRIKEISQYLGTKPGIGLARQMYQYGRFKIIVDYSFMTIYITE